MQKTGTMPMDEVVRNMLKVYGLGASHNTHLIFKAWDEASGAGPYTIKKYFRAGTLYVTLNSSVARIAFQMQSDVLVTKINAILASDPLFIRDDKCVGYVTKLVLK